MSDDARRLAERAEELSGHLSLRYPTRSELEQVVNVLLDLRRELLSTLDDRDRLILREALDKLLAALDDMVDDRDRLAEALDENAATQRVAEVMVRRYGARQSEETEAQARVLARAALASLSNPDGEA